MDMYDAVGKDHPDRQPIVMPVGPTMFVTVNEWPLGKHDVDVSIVDRIDRRVLVKAKAGHPFQDGTGEMVMRGDIEFYDRKWMPVGYVRMRTEEESND